jgi:hypothetical protein
MKNEIEQIIVNHIDRKISLGEATTQILRLFAVMQRSELLLDFVKWKNDKDKNWLKHIDEKEVEDFLKSSNSA